MNETQSLARDDLIRNQDLAREAANTAYNNDVMSARKEFREKMNGLMGGTFMAQDSGKTG